LTGIYPPSGRTATLTRGLGFTQVWRARPRVAKVLGFTRAWRYPPAGP